VTIVRPASRVVLAPLRGYAYRPASTSICRTGGHFLGYRFSGIFPAPVAGA